MTETIANPRRSGEPPAATRVRGATLCRVLHVLASGETSAVALAEAHLDAIAAQAGLNAYLPLDAAALAAVRAAAAASDARRAADGPIGRLDGVPLAIKDNIDVAGLPTRCGLGGTPPPATRDAAVVARLRGAGAVLLGKTGVDEGVLGADGKNPHWGNVHNPWRRGYVAGGSSAGAAAAVAAGLAVAALGSDSLGSSRIPASYCGVFGFKPTYGEISVRGVHPAARRLDAVGLIARSVDDIGVLLHLLDGFDADDALSRAVRLALPDWEPGSLRVGLLDLAAWNVDAGVAALFEQALEALAPELPHRRRVDLGAFDLVAARRAGFFLMEAEILGAYAGELADPARAASPRFRQLLDYARGKSAADYAAADRLLDAARLAARRLFRGVDVLITPTTPQTAFAHDASVPANQADFTAFANLSGCPALSLPMGLSADGLPAGLQLLGAPGSDLRLLELGAVLAAALDRTPDYPVGDA